MLYGNVQPVFCLLPLPVTVFIWNFSRAPCWALQMTAAQLWILSCNHLILICLKTWVRRDTGASGAGTCSRDRSQLPKGLLSRLPAVRQARIYNHLNSIIAELFCVECEQDPPLPALEPGGAAGSCIAKVNPGHDSPGVPRVNLEYVQILIKII